jgi:hypothetical protein
VKEFPVPTSHRNIREFTGLVNYFRHMVRDHAKLSGQLTRLLTKEANWKGGRLPDRAMAAFCELRRRLTSAPLLAYPRNDRPFILSTDAATGDATSTGGLGAVLTQRDDDGNERVVAFASRNLTKHEKNYSAFLLEMLAATWAIDHFHVYLYGNRFTLKTDHKPLEKLSTIHTKTLNRLKQQMSEYSFIMEHRPGKDNQAADALSRNPIGAISADTNILGLTPNEFQRIQAQEPLCLQLRLHRQTGQLPADQQQRTNFLKIRDRLSEGPDSLVYVTMEQHGYEAHKCLLLPEAFREEVFRAAHCTRFSGHGGQMKTIERIRRQYYWKGMAEDIKRWVSECLTCSWSKNPPRHLQQHYPHQPLPIPDEPNI